MKLDKVKRIGARLVSWFHDKPLAPATPLELELVEELRATYRAMPSKTQGHCSPAEDEWLRNVERLRELVCSFPDRTKRGHVCFKT